MSRLFEKVIAIFLCVASLALAPLSVRRLQLSVFPPRL